MANILVSGTINIETNVRVDGFPVVYNPAQFVFFGIQSNVSGVGYNLTKSLVTLGNQVTLLALTGDDPLAAVVRDEIRRIGVDSSTLLPLAAGTMQSLILYDPEGKRQIFSDLKNVQELSYPLEVFQRRLEACDLCVLTTLNMNRALIDVVKQSGKLLACDVQAISSLEDEYNGDFLRAADVLFFSHDRIGGEAPAFVAQAAERFGAQVIVAGMGADGAHMYVRADQRFVQLPAVMTRPVVNTVGAGDALFSSFLHFYLKLGNPYGALERAMVYASWKIGESGGAQGFMSEADCEGIMNLSR